MKSVTPAKELRNFGLIVGGTFALIALSPAVLSGGRPRLWALACAAILLVPAALFPMILSPLHAVWMKVGHGLGWVNSRILLGVIFFMLITPVGLLVRMLGKDPMRLRPAGEAETYRVPKQARPGSHMAQQF